MKLRQMVFVGSFLVLLAGCGNNTVGGGTTTGTTTGSTTGTTTGGTTSGTTTGISTGGFFPTTTGGFPTTTGGATTGSTTGSTTGGTTGSTTGGTTGGAAGTISGTVTLPPGASVTGRAAVVACYLTGNQAVPCDETLSRVTEIQLTGVSSASYTVTNLQNGQYLVAALADADGNGSAADATDYIGFYPSFDSPAAVTPPQTGINITLQPAGSGGTPTPGGNLTGTWTGTTTTTQFGNETTTFELTQSGSNVSGTLALPESETTRVAGTVSGTSVTLSAGYTFNGAPLEYQYEGTLSGTTFEGSVTLVNNGVEGETGNFSVTRSSASAAPLDKALLNRLFRNIR